MLDPLITSKTRIRLLVKFFSNPHTKAYLREIAEEFGESTNSVRVELNRLSEAKLLCSEPDGRTIKYSANEKHPLFPDIRQIISKFLGLDQIAQNIVSKLGEVDRALVIGDYAKGIDSGTIELVIVGESVDTKLLAELTAKAEKLIKRRIQPQVMGRAAYEAAREGNAERFRHPILVYSAEQ